LGHQWISDLYTKIFNHFGRTKMETYDHYISILLAIFLIVLFSLFSPLKQLKERWKRIFFLWGIGLGMAILADKILICTNIERIHFFQYAFLAIIIRSVLQDDFSALWITSYAGILDEVINYIWHPQFTKYLDFNDFILNFIGAFLGIAFFATFCDSHYPSSITYHSHFVYKAKKFVCLTGIVFVVLFFGGILTKHLILYHPPTNNEFLVLQRLQGRYTFILSFIKPNNFWTVTSYGRKYHILSPFEGISVLSGLFLGSLGVFQEHHLKP